MGRRIRKFGVLVRVDSGVLSDPKLAQPTDRTTHDARKIPLDEPGVPAGDHHFRAEGVG